MPDTRVRYKEDPSVILAVHLIKTWRRGDIDHQDMSISGGPKEQFKNDVYAFFDADPTIDAVSMVRAGGPMFYIFRKGRSYFDVAGKEVEVIQK